VGAAPFKEQGPTSFHFAVRLLFLQIAICGRFIFERLVGSLVILAIL